MQIQNRIASVLKLASSSIRFAALKDRRAVAIQYASIKGIHPREFAGEAYTATLVGRLDRVLGPGDLAGNRFSIVIRDMSEREAKHISQRLEEISHFGLPNYYDKQRFGSFHPEDGLIGAHIIRRDAYHAVKAYLSLPYPGEPVRVKRFKKFAAANWRDWEKIFEQAPRPSNFRSLLTFLRDHPDDYRKCLNLVPQPLLSLWLEAYQSLLWNQIVASYIRQQLFPLDIPLYDLSIADTSLPVYGMLPAKIEAKLGSCQITMPHHKAVYSDPELNKVVMNVLKEQDLALVDLKARILKKAYLSRHRRSILCFPRQVEIGMVEADDQFAQRKKQRVTFTLPPGSYATLVVKCAGKAGDF